MSSYTIREMPASRAEACKGILRALPEWFGIESYVESYAADAEGYLTIGAYDQAEALVGFVTLRPRSEGVHEIHVMGVLPQHHGRGIGTRLIAEAKAISRKLGYHTLEVRTLGPSKPDPYYEKTRVFYERVGFKIIEELHDVWPDNPCLVMAVSLT